MKIKLLLLLVCSIMAVCGFAQSGKCGDDLTWSFNSSTGTLTISGMGKMDDFQPNTAPWVDCREQLRRVVIENNVTSIGNFAFFGYFGLTSFTIPESVTSIGGSAFSGCKITSVTIPDSVEHIGWGAFAFSPVLTSVKIGTGVMSIKGNSFDACPALTSIEVDNANLFYLSENDVLFNKSKTTLICFPAGKTGSYIIPNSVMSIEGHAFYGCIGLTSVTIPNSVMSIESYAFYGCIGLTTVTIDADVKSISDETFFGCTALTAITIPNSVESIGNFAFQDCTELTSIIIPNNVKSIGSNAFQHCTGLTSLTIGNNVTQISSSAFQGCTALTSIINLNPIPTNINFTVFHQVDKKMCVLKVPAGSVELYQQASIWKDFKITGITSVQKIQATQISVYPNPASDYFCISGITENSMMTVSDINGKIVFQQMVSQDRNISASHLTSGVYLVNVKDKILKIIKQ